MILTLSIILTVIIIVSFFIIRNLLKQNEKLEDIIIGYENFITKQGEAIDVCDERLKQVDDKGIFRSDDEIGWFFKEIKQLQEALNEFTVK